MSSSSRSLHAWKGNASAPSCIFIFFFFFIESDAFYFLYFLYYQNIILFSQVQKHPLGESLRFHSLTNSSEFPPRWLFAFVPLLLVTIENYIDICVYNCVKVVLYFHCQPNCLFCVICLGVVFLSPLSLCLFG